MRYTVLDLFSGVGGLSYPFHKDNSFDVAVANEILQEPATAYMLNYPKTKMYNTDIRQFSLQKVQQDIGIKNFDVMLGGPPCQSYSTAGKRDTTDPRTQLFKEYYRVLKHSNAKMFIFENVKGILSIHRGELFKEILSIFESLGYRVQYKILNAVEYGVPQNRERVIVVGTRYGLQFQFPESTHGLNKQPFLTVADAVGDLPFIKANQQSIYYKTPPQNNFQALMRRNSATLADHSAPNNNDKLVKIMELLPDGGTPKDLPKNLQPKSGFCNTYCRLWWNKPSTTITRNLGTPSSARCIHPKAPRPLTTREGARLQSFPDSYIFYGSRGKKNLQIGEAVPPLLAGALMKSVKQCLEVIQHKTILEHKLPINRLIAPH